MFFLAALPLSGAPPGGSLLGWLAAVGKRPLGEAELAAPVLGVVPLAACPFLAAAVVAV